MTDKPVNSEGLGRVWAKNGDNIDPDTINAGKVESSGWLPFERPPNQFMNWILRFVSQWCNYVNEEGVARWDSVTEYRTGSFAKGSDNNLYRSLVDNNINNNPIGSPTEWQPYGVSGSTTDDVTNTSTVSGATATDALNTLSDTEGIEDIAYSNDFNTPPSSRNLTDGLYAAKIATTRNIYADNFTVFIPVDNVFHEIGRVSVPLDKFVTAGPSERYYQFEAMIYTEGSNGNQIGVNIETFLNNVSTDAFDEASVLTIHLTSENPNNRVVFNNNSQQGGGDNSVGFSDSNYIFGSSSNPGVATIKGTFVLTDGFLDVDDNLELRIFATATNTGATFNVLPRSWYAVRPIYDYNPLIKESP